MRRTTTVVAVVALAGIGARAAEPDDHRSYLAHIAAAAAHLRLHETSEARRWLESAPVAHRGWEWRWLDGASRQEAAGFEASEEPVTSVGWSPDGERLAVADRAGAVTVRDPGTGMVLLTLAGHERGVHAVVFSPDGSRLATASSDRTVRLWDAASGAELRVWPEVGRGVAGLAFDPGGERLAYTSWGYSEERGVWGVARVLEVGTGREIAYLEYRDKPVRSVAWSPDGRLLAAGSWDSTVAVWELPPESGPDEIGEPRVLEPPPTGGYQAVQSVAFHPGGTRLAVASRDGRVRLWDAASGELFWTAGDGGAGHTKDVNGLAFSAGGSTLASVSTDQTVRLWDADTGRPLGVLHGHTTGVGAVALRRDVGPGAARLATGADDGTVKLWDPLAAAGARHLWEHPAAVYDLAWSPDGSRVATASYEGWLTVWSAASGERLLRTQVYPEETFDASLNSVAWLAGGERLATATNHGRIELREAATGQVVATLAEAAESQRMALTPSPDGEWLAVPGPDGAVELRRLAAEAAGGAVEGRLEGHGGQPYDAAWSPDGRLLATVDLGGGAYLWDPATGERRADLGPHPGGATSVAISPDGALLATGAGDGTLRLFRLPGGDPAGVLRGHDGFAWSVRFSPGGRRLVSASDDFTVRLWDPASGQPVLTLPFDRAAAYAAWSPDGRSLAVALFDGTVRVLEAAPGPGEILLRAAGPGGVLMD